jgi:hypothetical protein
MVQEGSSCALRWFKGFKSRFALVQGAKLQKNTQTSTNLSGIFCVRKDYSLVASVKLFT